jgi:hypothetical protein
LTRCLLGGKWQHRVATVAAVVKLICCWHGWQWAVVTAMWLFSIQIMVVAAATLFFFFLWSTIPCKNAVMGDGWMGKCM